MRPVLVGPRSRQLKILVTGCAGFIGFHVASRLLDRGDAVVGFDQVNDYYDPTLKEARLGILAETARRTGSSFSFIRANLADQTAVNGCFAAHRFDRVIHLAAQAGVRYSLDNPLAYVESNLVGFTNILEACRHAAVGHLTYASTSSVYGANTSMPFREDEPADHPLQFYAATKRANELMAHSYSHLFALPTTGLRFFTVYGPWGRPDMAPSLFARAILAGEPIKLFNGGNHVRDFTYVGDIAEGVVRASDRTAQADRGWDGDRPDPSTSAAPWCIYNIGSAKPVSLVDFVGALEDAFGIKAKREYLPMQAGDVHATSSSSAALEAAVGYKPATPITEGVRNFADWYLRYYGRPSA